MRPYKRNPTGERDPIGIYGYESFFLRYVEEWIETENVVLASPVGVYNVLSKFPVAQGTDLRGKPYDYIDLPKNVFLELILPGIIVEEYAGLYPEGIPDPEQYSPLNKFYPETKFRVTELITNERTDTVEKIVVIPRISRSHPMSMVLRYLNWESGFKFSNPGAIMSYITDPSDYVYRHICQSLAYWYRVFDANKRNSVLIFLYSSRIRESVFKYIADEIVTAEADFVKVRVRKEGGAKGEREWMRRTRTVLFPTAESFTEGATTQKEFEQDQERIRSAAVARSIRGTVIDDEEEDTSDLTPASSELIGIDIHSQGLGKSFFFKKQSDEDKEQLDKTTVLLLENIIDSSYEKDATEADAMLQLARFNLRAVYGGEQESIDAIDVLVNRLGHSARI
jgi:hypothetical protein